MTEIIERFIDAGPITGVLSIVILIGAVREWWVWGFIFRREVKEKEYWREKALTNLGLAEESLDMAADSVAEDMT